MYNLGQASEAELERVTAEAGERPFAGKIENVWAPWLAIGALAVFLWVAYRTRPPRGSRRIGKAAWS